MKLAPLALGFGFGLLAMGLGCGDEGSPSGAPDDEPSEDRSAAGRDASTGRSDAAPVDGGAADAQTEADASASSDGGDEPDAEEPLDAGDEPDAAWPDPAALIVSTPSGTVTNELGGQITFTVHLARAPIAPVTLPLASSDVSEGVVNPTELIFDEGDWDAPKTVTVTGQPDTLVDGTIDYQIMLGPAASDDVGYAGRTAPALALQNEDHPLPAYQPVDISHFLITGQSNAVANGSHPNPTTGPNPAYGNLSFDVGVMTAKSCDGDGCREYETPRDFVPIREGDVFPLSATPRETMSSSFAHQGSFLGETVYFPGTQYRAHDILVSIHGRSGNPYHCLRFGGCTWYAGRNYIVPFEEGMRQVRDAKALAAAKQKSYAVRGVGVVHGESDHHGYGNLYPQNGTDGAPNAVRNYADALIEWQRDYEREIQAITGQTSPIPLYAIQMQWSERAVNEIAIDQYEASVRAPGKVILVAPSYILGFHRDCLHYSFASHRRMGEYFGKAYAQTVFTGAPFSPLRPLAIDRQGNVLTVRYHVPVPPLVFDTTEVSDPGNYGFVFVDDGNTASISAVEIIAADTVRITLSATPTGNDKRLRYAVSTSRVMCAGPSTGIRGNLRDSDTTPSQRGDAPLANWGIGFQMAVP